MNRVSRGNSFRGFFLFPSMFDRFHHLLFPTHPLPPTQLIGTTSICGGPSEALTRLLSGTVSIISWPVQRRLLWGPSWPPPAPFPLNAMIIEIELFVYDWRHTRGGGGAGNRVATLFFTCYPGNALFIFANTLSDEIAVVTESLGAFFWPSITRDANGGVGNKPR